MGHYCYKYGNIVDSEAKLIAHQVNSIGVMNSGVAKDIKEKWPEVFNQYKKVVDSAMDKSKLLGTCQVCMTEDGKYIANLFGQEDFGYDGKRYTSYDALYEAMVSLADFCKENNIKWISIPRFIGCGRGGGSTRIVSSIIEEAFRDCHIMLEFWTLASDNYRTIYNS